MTDYVDSFARILLTMVTKTHHK